MAATAASFAHFLVLIIFGKMGASADDRPKGRPELAGPLLAGLEPRAPKDTSPDRSEDNIAYREVLHEVVASSFSQRRVADGEVRRTTAGPDSSAAHSSMRRRLRAKERKCHTTIESRDMSWRKDSLLPLQTVRRSRARTTLRRRSRPRESHRG